MPSPGATLMKGLLEAFILHSLEEEPKHGYALLKEMGDRFGEEPNRNKIYPLLGRFEEEGLVRGVEEEDGGRGRTVYALSAKGREALEEYRRMPDPFLEAVLRMWGEGGGGAPAQPSRAGPVDAGGLAPRPGEDLPYPCADARALVEKNPVSGDLALRLIGCPMGAYDYCVRCPMWKAVEGFRRLTFG